MRFNSLKRNRCFIIGLQLAFASYATAQAVCETDDCKELSTDILDNIQQTADPCIDFYQYACGSWSQKHPAPPGVAMWSHNDLNDAKLKQQLKGLLEEPESPSDTDAVKAAKRQYRACTNEAELNAQGVTILLNKVNENGGWPMIQSADFVSSKSWQEIHDEYNRNTGFGSLYKILVYSDDVSSTKNSIFLDQPDHYPIYLSGESVLKKCVQYVQNVAAKFVEASGSSVTKQAIEQDAHAVCNFIKAVEELKNPDKYRKRGPSMSVSEANVAIVNGTNVQFNLLEALQKTFDGIEGVTITATESIHINEMEYLNDVMKLIQNTPSRVVLNYIHFMFLDDYLVYTTSEMREFQKEMYNEQTQDRPTVCMNNLNLIYVLSNMYLKRYFSKNAKIAVESLVRDVKNTIEKQVKRTSWLTSEESRVAVEKLHDLVEVIAYDDWLVDDEALNSFYAAYKMGDNYLQNILNYDGVNYKKQLSSLREIRDLEKIRKSASITAPISLRSNYKLRYNRLELPAADLHLPFFSLNSVTLANYAAVGGQVAYLLHGLYDEFGIQVNSHGEGLSWLENNAEYDARSTCFSQQYNGYTVKELEDAGIHYNLSEPFLVQTAKDSFALKAVLETYEEKVKEGATDQILPNLSSYNKEKQFFLAFANPYCVSVNIPEFEKLLDNLLFATPRIRLNSAISNSPKFSEVFACPAGSPMNPIKKCTLFD